MLCFALYARANSKYKPPGGLIFGGAINGGFLCYDFGGLIFGGAYTLTGLFSEFYGIYPRPVWGYKAVSYLSHDFFYLFIVIHHITDDYNQFDRTKEVTFI